MDRKNISRLAILAIGVSGLGGCISNSRCVECEGYQCFPEQRDDSYQEPDKDFEGESFEGKRIYSL